MDRQPLAIRVTRRRLLGLMAGATALAALPAPALAAPAGRALPSVHRRRSGDLTGSVIRAALIGGSTYEEMYKSVPIFEQQTGAKVEIVYKGNGFDIDKKLKTDYAAGTVDYDVAWDHTSFFSQYVKLDALEPLEGYWTEAELADFIPSILNSARTNGHLWQIPRHFDISALHYRTDVLGDPNVQAKIKERVPDFVYPDSMNSLTWDQFKAIALAVNNPPELYGTQFAGKEEALTGRFYEVLLAEGGKLLDDTYHPVFNSPAGVKAIKMMADLYQANAMPKGMTNFLWDDVAKNWVNGNIAMYTEWYGWYSYFQDPKSSKVAGKFDLARQPMGDGKIHSGWAGAHAFSIPKAAKNKEGAVALIKFFTDETRAYEEAKLGYSPVRNSTWERIIADAAQSTDPLAKKRLELNQLQAKEDFRTPPLIAEWLPLSNVVFPILQSIIVGDKQPQEGLDEAVAKVDQIMKEAGYYS